MIPLWLFNTVDDDSVTADNCHYFSHSSEQDHHRPTLTASNPWCIKPRNGLKASFHIHLFISKAD